MSSFRLPSSLLAIAFSALLSTASAVVLRDLPHADGLRFSKRGDPMQCLDLKSQETFVWGGSDESQTVLGNLTVYMPGEAENLLSMDRFRGMLDSVTCTNETMDLVFKDDDCFTYAKKVWDWVNGADNHSFVMVADTGDCGWNEYRQPFTVSTLQYDDTTSTAHLAVIAQNWTDAIHTYDLNVGGIPQDGLSKRSFGEIDFNKDLSLDFNHQLPSESISVPAPVGISLELDLSNCSTSGSFAFEFTLETVLLIPKKAEMNIHPQDVSALMNPRLTLTADMPKPSTYSVTLDKISLAGISISGGILDIGPQIIFTAGTTIGPVNGHATVSTGATFGLDNSAHATVDVLGSGSSQSGWTPSVIPIPTTVDASINGSVKIFVEAEVALVATAFGTGFSVSLGIEPYVRADLSTITCEPVTPPSNPNLLTK